MNDFVFRERTSGIPGAVDKRESRKDGSGNNLIGLSSRKGNQHNSMHFFNFQYFDQIEKNCLCCYILKSFDIFCQPMICFEMLIVYIRNL